MKAFFMAIAAFALAGTGPALATDMAGTHAAADPANPDPAARAAVPIPGVVTRSQFTHDVKDLEPVDAVSTLTNDQTRIAYFTEIHDMAGQAVVHRWEYNGKIIMEVPIKVGTSRWRAYSTKTLLPSWLGDWKVSVVDAAGGTLSVNTFTYIDSPEPKVTPQAVMSNPAR